MRAHQIITVNSITFRREGPSAAARSERSESAYAGSALFLGPDNPPSPRWVKRPEPSTPFIGAVNEISRIDLDRVFR